MKKVADALTDDNDGAVSKDGRRARLARPCGPLLARTDVDHGAQRLLGLTTIHIYIYIYVAEAFQVYSTNRLYHVI